MSKQKDLIDKVFAGYEIEVEGGYINIYKKTKIACSRIDKQGIRFEKGFNDIGAYEKKRILKELNKGRY